MTLPCSRNAAFNPSPRHHRGFRCQSAFKDLVPPDDFPVFRYNEFFDPLDEIALQLLLILQSFSFDACLAFRAALPVRFVGLVAANVDILRREQCDHFGKHILHEREN